MPYIKGGTQQRTSTKPDVYDIYHSPNVFINNVAAGIWLEAGTSAAYANIDLAPVALIDPVAVAAANVTVNDYIANPSAYNNPTAAADGVKANYAGTVDDGTTSTGILSTAPSASDIIPFLDARLAEARRGMWRETGQGGNSSNANITGIWTNLGYSGAPWTTDQTAWCMGFVNFALKGSGYVYVQTASAAAITQTPARWNATQVPKDQAQPGDIAFWSYRHVNFVYTANNGKFSFVGGNQTPTGGSNNPSDGDITNSYPSGTSASNPNWVSCWRPSRTPPA
jgi:hypothetical protein